MTQKTTNDGSHQPLLLIKAGISNDQKNVGQLADGCLPSSNQLFTLHIKVEEISDHEKSMVSQQLIMLFIFSRVISFRIYTQRKSWQGSSPCKRFR